MQEFDLDFTELRIRTTLVCGALSLAIAASTLLRGRVRTIHLLFSAFAADIGLWYLSQSLTGFLKDSPAWQRLPAIFALLLPLFALNLFEAMVPHEPHQRSRLLRFAGAMAVPLLLLVLSSLHVSKYVRGGVFLYVVVLLTAGLYMLGQRGKKSSSRETQRRVRFLVVIGALAGVASLVDFAFYLNVETPPIGAALSIVFLFVLAQALRNERLLDISEMFARLLVATAVAFLIAFIFYLLTQIFGDFRNNYVNAVLAAIVLLVVFEPLRERVEEQIQKLFFRERFDMDKAIASARRRLVHILEVDEMGAIVMNALERSRRVTAAAVYLRDQDGVGFDRLVGLGARVPVRIEVATAHAVLDRLEKGPVAFEEVERDVRERKARGEKLEGGDAVLAYAPVLGSLSNGVLIGIRDEVGDLIGLLIVADDRVHDAFSTDETSLLQGLAVQIGVVIENSRVYAQMKERDRLAVLGQMAAGLAHEIRNPLGAIKGAAQLLSEPAPGQDVDPASREFVGIILEEVDRLNRVVGSMLDFARPRQGIAGPTDVNAVVRRTVQVLSTERAGEDLGVHVELEPGLPRVSVDPEQLRQVLMNLFRNAAQAMKGHGEITISTRKRVGRVSRAGIGMPAEEAFVELSVIDNGPGISHKILDNIFLPFFTTKEQGSGLGLSISQRIVQNAGGRIDVRSSEGKGSTFAVLLPATTDALSTPIPANAEREPKPGGDSVVLHQASDAAVGK